MQITDASGFAKLMVVYVRTSSIGLSGIVGQTGKEPLSFPFFFLFKGFSHEMFEVWTKGDSWRAKGDRDDGKGVELLTYCYLGNSTKCSSSSSCLHLSLLPLPLLSSGFFFSPRRSLLLLLLLRRTSTHQSASRYRRCCTSTSAGLLKYNRRTCDCIQRVIRKIRPAVLKQQRVVVIISRAHVRDLFVFFRRFHRTYHLASGYVLEIFLLHSGTLNLPSRCETTLKAFR